MEADSLVSRWRFRLSILVRMLEVFLLHDRGADRKIGAERSGVFLSEYFCQPVGLRFGIVLVDAALPRSYALHEENPVVDGDLTADTATQWIGSMFMTDAETTEQEVTLRKLVDDFKVVVHDAEGSTR